MKKIFLYTLIIVFTSCLTSCSCEKKQPMDQISEEQGGFYYQNKDLGFTLILPPEFEYYQTQRKETNNYIDIEFFVPTSDIEQQIEVPGYAKPMVIRIFKQSDWQGVMQGHEDLLLYEEIDQNNGNTYTIKFWYNIPNDWKDKWNDKMMQKIKASIKLN